MIVKQEIIVIDQTIREGMQHRGLMFSLSERKKILAFQESIGVDVSQIAYPSAHPSEMEIARYLSKECKRRNYKIRVACHGRAIVKDIEIMAGLGIKDFHLHSGVNERMIKRLGVSSVYDSLKHTVEYIKLKCPCGNIKVSLLDIGNTDKTLLKECAQFLAEDLRVDILALPDTSGIISPYIFYETVKYISKVIAKTNTMIAVHCHNDLGMSSANTIMGIIAGARVVEVSAMGIGERNGIGDIFLVGKCLKQEGFSSNLQIENIDTFRDYYEYVNHLYEKKLGDSYLTYNTPFWGEAVRTHVAGTHGCFEYGVNAQADFCINVLCGKNLLKKFLDSNGISYSEVLLKPLVQKVKDESVSLGRSLSKKEVIRLINSTRV